MGITDFMKAVADFAKDAGKSVRDILFKQLAAICPGLTLDGLRAGELPIATDLLQRELSAWVAEQEGLEAIALTSELGCFKLALHTRKWGLRFVTTLFLEVETFCFSVKVKEVRLHCKERPMVKGANFMGRMFSILAGGLIRKALRSQAIQSRISRESNDAVTLAWPEVFVDLERIPALNKLAGIQYGGIGLLDVVAFGPIRIEQERVFVAVKFIDPPKP